MFTVWLTNEQKITAEDVSHFEAVGIPIICLLEMTAQKINTAADTA